VRVAEKSNGVNGVLLSEAQRAYSGGRVVGEGVQGGALAVQRFFCTLRVSGQLILLHYLGVNSC